MEDKIELSEDGGLIIPRSMWPKFGPFGEGIGRKDPSRYMHEDALCLLLAEEGLLFISGGRSHFLTSESEREDIETSSLRLSVNCNDTFHYACADSQPVPFPVDYVGEHPFWDLYDLVREHGGRGAIKWACLRRKQLPLSPIVNRWKADGFWDEELEDLE